MEAARIRNFAIIAHIDHGKSTLADRLLELTGSLAMREMQEQVLDSMDLERERGITIKAHAVRMLYPAQDGQIYQLNLIDTPGHVDFSYEVSRSLAACEGALLVVDASQGVEAQTLANSYLAINHGLEIIPVINKIDLQSADIPRTKEMIESAVGLDASDALLISAKTGQGVPDVLEAIVKRVPPPKGSPDRHLQALLFDSWFDPYRGVVVLARVFEGTVAQGAEDSSVVERHVFQVETLGVLTPKPVEIDELVAGEVGFIIANIKNVADTKIGDTITDDDRPSLQACRGLKKSSPWCSPDCTRWTRTNTLRVARGAGKTEAERLVVLLRAGKFGGARIRLPLRLSGACCTWRSSRSAWSANTIST
jgi:GTP-binding protein LepA